MKISDPIPQIIKDIKSVKIQGATNVAIASLQALKKKIKLFPKIDKQDLIHDVDALKNARPTEPMTKNACVYLSEKINSSKEEDWQKKILSEIDLFLSKINDINYEIVERGTSLIKKDLVVLTHCHSSLVEKILIESVKRNRNLTVFVTETRPLNQGQITAKNLTRAGVEVVMITDSEAANILANGYDKNGKNIKINIVLVGADAINKNGQIAFNKTGTYGIAESAHANKIPLYIVSSLLKVSKDKVVIEVRKDSEISSLKRRNFDVYNPAYDAIPAALINGYLTEFGLISSKKIEYFVSRYYPFILQKKIHTNLPNLHSIKATTITKKTDSFNPYLNYLHLQEKLDTSKMLLAFYKLTTGDDVDFLRVAGGVAAESSVGTWTKVQTQFEKAWEHLHARVLEADKKTGILKIAYPIELFEKCNIAQLLSSVSGNIFGLKDIKNLRLLDLVLPEEYVKSFSGPAIGMNGVLKIAGVKEGPLIGSIIKPKLGLSFKEHVKVAMDVFRAGGSLVKDDENLTSQTFNPFFERVKLMTEEMKKFKFLHNPSGEKIYAFNVTAEAEEMKERASFVKTSGGNCAMIDILTAGFSSVQFLRNQNLGLIIHGHRAMHAAFTRDIKEGVTMLVLAKLSRLAGVDELHTGTVVGKMEGGEEEVVAINNFLRSDWFGLKPVMPVASGGLFPGLIPDLIKYLGKNVIYNFGGGIHGHPKGTYHGVKAVKEGFEAVVKGENWDKYVGSHQDLKEAMEQWGK